MESTGLYTFPVQAHTYTQPTNIADQEKVTLHILEPKQRSNFERACRKHHNALRTTTVDLDAFAQSIGNGRIFTRTLLLQTAAALQRVNDPFNEENIYLKDLRGIECIVWDPFKRDL